MSTISFNSVLRMSQQPCGLKAISAFSLHRAMTRGIQGSAVNLLSRIQQVVGYKDERSFYQAFSALVGINEGDDRLRVELAKIAGLTLAKQLLTDPIKLKQTLVNLPNYQAWTASGVHRFMPLAVCVGNILKQNPMLSPNPLSTLLKADERFAALNKTLPLFGNPENVPAEYFPIYPAGPILQSPAPSAYNQSGQPIYRWLDIGSAPKTGGAPTLNLLRDALPTLFPDYGFEYTGSDCSFPFFQITPEGRIERSIYFDAKDELRNRVEYDGVTYINANRSENDIMQGMAAYPEGHFSFESVCMVLHHLKTTIPGGPAAYPVQPFSTFDIFDPAGNILREEISGPIANEQVRVIDTLLSKLGPNGILFLVFTPLLWAERDIAYYVNHNNDDLFFVLQRRSDQRAATFFPDSPIPFRPNATPFHPQVEHELTQGSHTRFPFLSHIGGIAGIYPEQSPAFYLEINKIFARANTLIFQNQGWDRGAWGSISATTEKINERRSLLEIFETYLRFVDDANPYKIKLLNEVRALQEMAV